MLSVFACPVTRLTWVVDDELAWALHKPPDRDAQCRQLRGGDEQLLHEEGGDEGNINWRAGLVAMATTERGVLQSYVQQELIENPLQENDENTA